MRGITVRRRAVVAALTALAAAGMVTASASALDVSGGTLSASSVGHPCPGTALASPVGSTDWFNPGYAGLQVTLPEGCAEATVDVTVLSGSTVVAQGAGTVDGTATVATDLFTDPDVTVQATVDGWALRVAYSYVPPATCTVTAGSGTCDATVTVWTGQRPGGSSSALYFDVWVTTTSSSWLTWEVTFDLGNPYYGQTVTRLGNSDLDSYTDAVTTWSQGGYVNDVHRTSDCSALPSLTVAGDTTSRNNNRDFAVVRAGRDRFFSLVVNRTETGYDDVLTPGC
ncbi:hypothetical protein OEB99_12185 [Actinotalea sp. M2MS4P-6]|uniref:hypothetical protein n=1 Tax=Actinotalea sp. M2MS4P-6 TaxID=2983762 RepID=UPI0021E47629|nr:hypothetical protein [Actinotalea sp. M2MS4P-6]MCV2395068.1 hypothetical protein [Actinotalea sp. M2MS4P-6]